MSIDSLAAAQPVFASAIRAVRQLGDLGDPLPPDVLAKLTSLEASSTSDTDRCNELEALLSPFVLLTAEVDEHGVCSSRPGAAPPILVQHGWRSFLIRVVNPHRIQASLAESSAWWMPSSTKGVFGLIDQVSSAARTMLPDTLSSVPRIRDSWLEAKVASPAQLSGLEAEYKIVSLYSRDSGVKRGTLQFFSAVPEEPASLTRSAHQLAQRRSLLGANTLAASFEFESLEANEIRFDIREPDGQSCVAAITVRDAQGRAYPSKAMRLAPDMFFQEHVYRATGEVVRLPVGRYQISAIRGPEYREVKVDVEIEPRTEELSVKLDRWVDPASRGYYSGDPHLHAGGCSHYNIPTEGVTPETMIRHVRGEGLWLGSVLTWGPCYYHQKQFFTGETVSPAALLEYPDMQQAQGMTWAPQRTDRDGESMLRYDIEVSGFPSSHSGHVILLGLTDQDYPDTQVIEDWPSWNLPIMQWGQSQNALVGYAHCGYGLSVSTDELPNYVIPSFASCGSNEIIIDVPLGAADFQCGAEISPAAELNVWYHLLNVGYRTLMLGETDYPCIYDEGPGVGRTYVQLSAPPHGERAMEAWTAGLKENASYFGDGRSHVFDLAIEGNTNREHSSHRPGSFRVTATIAAWLPEEPPEPPAGLPTYSAPMGWHLERARIGQSRNVLLELIVNGVAVATSKLAADGAEYDIAFDVELTRSSWVALRILPSVHTQPIFVEIEGKPIRSSRHSAQWLHDCVEALWNAKSGFIREQERAAARAAYDTAKAAYLRRLHECEAD